MADNFAAFTGTLTAPYAYGAAVTPADGADLATSCRALWIGGTGAVKVTTVGGDTITLAAVPVGLLLIRAARVWSTGTTATSIVALW